MGAFRVVNAANGAVWADLQYDDATLAINRLAWENASPFPVTVTAQKGAVTRSATVRPGTGGSVAIPAGLGLALGTGPDETQVLTLNGISLSVRWP